MKKGSTDVKMLVMMIIFLGSIGWLVANASGFIGSTQVLTNTDPDTQSFNETVPTDPSDVDVSTLQALFSLASSFPFLTAVIITPFIFLLVYIILSAITLL